MSRFSQTFTPHCSPPMQPEVFRLFTGDEGRANSEAVLAGTFDTKLVQLESMQRFLEQEYVNRFYLYGSWPLDGMMGMQFLVAEDDLEDGMECVDGMERWEIGRSFYDERDCKNKAMCFPVGSIDAKDGRKFDEDELRRLVRRFVIYH